MTTRAASGGDTTSAYDISNPQCPTQQVLDRIASKWTMLVILALSGPPLRYTELQRKVAGVTKKMLTETLRGLERDGLVLRRVYATVPVQTEYQLTALGRSLAGTVAVVRAWAYDNVEVIAQSRAEFDGEPRRFEGSDGYARATASTAVSRAPAAEE